MGGTLPVSTGGSAAVRSTTRYVRAEHGMPHARKSKQIPKSNTRRRNAGTGCEERTGGGFGGSAGRRGDGDGRGDGEGWGWGLGESHPRRVMQEALRHQHALSQHQASNTA
eukprot:1331451-Rhodomonas_salina.1